MNPLRVRVYDVKFGDAILVSVPDGNRYRHLLVDFGNVKSGEGGDDEIFLPVVRDVLDQLGGRPLDLYISTHEHLDHVQGLPYASRKLAASDPPVDLAKVLDVKRVWLTASADPDYGKRFPDAKKKMQLQNWVQFHRALYEAMSATRARVGREILPAHLAAMAANNNPGTTAHCVDYVRKLAPGRVSYVYRGVPRADLHEPQGVRVDILAPEEDSTVYYGRAPRHGAAPWTGDEDGNSLLAQVQLPPAPAGVDADAFRQLWEVFRGGGFMEALLQIDKAANNTSIVFRLEWRGWRLLFTGDAELRSWRTMDEQGVLSPVHFLKVSHHGSHNGTPAPEILDKVLGAPGAVGDRRVVVSSCAGQYSGIPDDGTDDKLKSRSKIFKRTSDDGLAITSSGARYIDFTFDPAGPPH